MNINLIESAIKEELKLRNDSNNETLFLKRIYSDGLNKYKQRLVQYGFSNKDHVLDAGCGFGQWTFALSSMNKKITCFDYEQTRVDFVNTITKKAQSANITCSKNSIDKLPYQDNTFDAVFCYGVIFLTPWKESLKELSRVLKKNGLLYVNANGFGWYKYLWFSEHNKTKDYNPKLSAATALMNTCLYAQNRDDYFHGDIVIEPNELKDELKNLGFENIILDGEGLINNKTGENIFFKKEYLGDIGVYEVLSQKK